MTVDSSKRRYESPVRRERAAMTRMRVVEAAAHVLTHRGYQGATLAEIAREAGVSVDSVRSCGTKAFLLLEAFRYRYTGEGGWASVLEQQVVQDIFAIDDTAEGLRAAATFLSLGHRQSARLWMIIRAAAATHPEVADGFAELSRLKEESFYVTTEWLIRIGALPPVAETDLRALVASVSFAMSAETYLLLTDDYGHDDATYEQWIVRTVPTLRP